MTAPRLRIRAEDDEDLAILSACLQDAIVPLSDIVYLREQKRFLMVVNRFKWEAPPEDILDEEPAPDVADAGAEEPGVAWNRVHGLLAVENVVSARTRGLDQNRRGQLLTLLALRQADGCLDLTFGGGGIIRLGIEGLLCRLEDLGDAWPTRWRPTHAAALDGAGVDGAGVPE